MKQKAGYLFWIIGLALGLMVLVAATQLFTNNNVSRLKEGNRDAAITFTLNNRLQELVNLSFEISTKFSQPPEKIIPSSSLRDSLTLLGYNASILAQVNMDSLIKKQFGELNRFVSLQVSTAELILEKISTKNKDTLEKITDSLYKQKLSDSIYQRALSIQEKLEANLQATLSTNTAASARLSAYNKTLAAIAVAAVLILGTIIIHHHLRQVKLISRLEEATAVATQSARIKDQFLANMSHEIRTPLNAVRGFSRLLKSTELNHEQQQYVDIIDSSSSSLINIVNDILDISKIEAGKLRIESKPFNLERLLGTISRVFSESAAEKKLTYSQSIDPDVPLLLYGDPDRLNQILINLLSNAVKFTKEGTIKLHVSLTGKQTGQSVLINFLVQDTGIGIPEDKVNIVFQRFEQLEAGQDDVIQGTGLGLSIVRNLTDLMGGTLALTSKYGEGSSFNVSLPFHIVTEGTDEKVQDEPMHDLYPDDFTGATVLVVDDNKINQLLLSKTLKKLGVIVLTAANGKEALDIISNRKTDLVLLDIQMPLMDGYTTIQKIREKGRPDLPVAAMTAYAMPGEKEKCIAAGMNEYLAKPLEFHRLIELLEKYCHQGKDHTAQRSRNKNASADFLLGLAGGDRELARTIATQIKGEVAPAIKRLKEVKHSGTGTDVANTVHYLLSTFAPLGNETRITAYIKALSEETVNKDIATDYIDKLIIELDELESGIDQILSVLV